eukprot:TRINITY_DN18790_c0_g1_i1.p1 TRINITY_DN18790_c0_g1~~TRINITY_DN18790_c0_g1_i1.p1  ORF type:complete len:210 (+),score=43.24 TRINITY_DN18790_c0_g1_i1:64-693(+)
MKIAVFFVGVLSFVVASGASPNSEAAAWFISTSLHNASNSCDGAPVTVEWTSSPTACMRDKVTQTYFYQSCSADGSAVVHHSFCNAGCKACVSNKPVPSGDCTSSISTSTSCDPQPPKPFNNSVQLVYYSGSKCTGEPTSGDTWLLNSCIPGGGAGSFNFFEWSPGSTNVTIFLCITPACDLDACAQSGYFLLGCQDENNASQKFIIIE